MELLLGQNHSAMVHLPMGAAFLAALAAIGFLFTQRKELIRFWAYLSVVALLSSIPTIVTGIAAAQGRYNGDGKPYLESGVIIKDTLQNQRLRRHQLLGGTGVVLALGQACLSLAVLRGRNPNKMLIAVLALALAIAWGVGGHLGGSELWGPDTFPRFH